MTPSEFVYPSNPENVSPAITQPSAAFKKEVSGVMGSIIFFFIVYLLIFIFSVALAVACIYGGIAIIVNVTHIIAILAGVGLIGLGIMVFIFVVKFLFAVSRYDRSGIIEITEADQPALFGFIRQLTKDTQTQFPKKIYLSADVNACVFYDSSFWSMFFPVKKNLQIGLGLVNSLNVSEFKAVMAHEFGHFSQRSMKLGSFVYNVNRIIHNMLFENESYTRFLQGWANIMDMFAFFAGVTVRIARAIQWVLRQMYGLINKNYMRLSREMEFHADAVAASVSGSKSLVTALRRAELASSGYTIALQKCDELFRQKKISSNIYRNQATVLLQLADEFNLPIQNGLPVVNDEFMHGNNHSRVNFKDQWASHPTIEDREEHLNRLAVDAHVVDEPAWILFNNREALQEQLTKKVYAAVQIDKEAEFINEKYFEERLHRDVQQFSLPQLYKGFYDNRLITAQWPDNMIHNDVHHHEELFSQEIILLPKKIRATVTDIETLKAIADKRIDTKTFDFDGQRYAQKDAPVIQKQLEEELKALEARLVQADHKAIFYFYTKAGTERQASLKDMYALYFEQRQKADEFIRIINTMIGSLQKVYQGYTIPIEEINQMISTLKDQHEPAFKKQLSMWLELDTFVKDPSFQQKVRNFLASNYQYFSGTSFFENELIELNSLCNESWGYVTEYMFGRFKDILVLQTEFVSSEA